MSTQSINSLQFGNDTYVFTTPYATCSAPGEDKEKTATITPISNFSLVKGVRVSVKFNAANTNSSPELNVNDSGAIPIYFRNATIPSSQYWAAGSTVDFVYDGEVWQMLGSQQNLTNVAFTNKENTFSQKQTITMSKNDAEALATNGQVKAYSFNATSDARLKENFQPLSPEKSILDLPTYKFDFIDGAKNQIGCKAQDLQEICPEIVNQGSDGYLSIQESKIVYLLLEEVKKLREEIDQLKRG